MTWSAMTLLQRLMILGSIAFVLILIPSLLPLVGIAPVWMTDVFYYPVLFIALFAVYLIYRASRIA